MVDRGSDVSWLSQYPHEQEIIWAPLTGLEVLKMQVDVTKVLTIEMRPSINLTNSTIDGVVSRLQRSHLQLIDMLVDALRVAGVPVHASGPLEVLRSEVERQDPMVFNDDAHYMAATRRALEVKRSICASLDDTRFWVSHGVESKEELASRMRSSAEVCARAGEIEAAIMLLKASLEHQPLSSDGAALVDEATATKLDTMAGGEWRVRVLYLLLEPQDGKLPSEGPWAATLVHLVKGERLSESPVRRKQSATLGLVGSVPSPLPKGEGALALLRLYLKRWPAFGDNAEVL
eukprot:6885582-Prymnesium_polylepis.1